MHGPPCAVGVSPVRSLKYIHHVTRRYSWLMCASICEDTSGDFRDYTRRSTNNCQAIRYAGNLLPSGSNVPRQNHQSKQALQRSEYHLMTEANSYFSVRAVHYSAIESRARAPRVCHDSNGSPKFRVRGDGNEWMH